MTLPRQVSYRAPVSGGASGLDFGPGTLLRTAQGSLPAYRNGVALAEAQDRINALGHVVLAGQSIADAIRSVTGTKASPTGARIMLCEGVYDIGPAGIVISATLVHIIALTPGTTTLRRTNARGAATAPMITLSGGRSGLYGLRLEDGDNAAYATVLASGDRNNLDFLEFDGGLTAISLTGNYNLATRCVFENVTTGVSDTGVGNVSDNHRTIP